MKVYTDANPKFICYVTEDSATNVQGVENVTNNDAEYLAVILALKCFSKDKDTGRSLEIHSDSQLVVKQLNREYAIKNAELRKLAIEAWNLMAFRKGLGLTTTFTWIPREQNLAGRVLG